MKVKIGTIVNSYDELNELFNTPMKAIVAMYVSSILEVVSKEKEAFEEKKVKLIHELGEEVHDDDGESQISVKEENMDEFYKKIDGLMEQEVFVCEEKINVNDLTTSNGDLINITPRCISKLKWLIEG